MMKKYYFSRLMQASLMCCMAVLLTACDDFFGSEDNPTSAYLSMSSKPVTIKVGDTFKREATSASTAVLEYSSSNTEVATVDKNGVVTANAEGEATITATGYSSVTGKKIYQPATVSYQLTVKHKPLTLEALSAGTILVSKPQPGMQYTKNGGAKKPVTTAAIDVVKGDKVAFFGNGTSITSYFDVNNSTYTAITGGTADVKVYGNIMSLVDEHHFDTATTLAVVAFANLFENNTHLKDAGALELPATTLAESCYSAMFLHCTSLTAAPALPATTLADGCYYDMFGGCTSLPAAPALPATKLAYACYQEMFQGCTSLTTAPEILPATTLADQCYTQMFNGCTSLIAAPALPATKLAEACYYAMFDGCTNLTAAPELPATTLADACYGYMFQNCTSLTAVPEILPATTLADACYYAMFHLCTSLTATPKLPATTLADQCYCSMFLECYSLTKAYVKANYNATNCATMFGGCTNSNTFIFYSDYYDAWKNGTALAGGLLTQWQKENYPTTE